MAESGQRSDCEQTADAGLEHRRQGLTGSLAMQQSWTVAFTNPHADPRSHHPLRAIPYRLSDSPAHPPKKRIAEVTSSAFPLRPGGCNSLSLGNSSLTSWSLTKVCIPEFHDRLAGSVNP
jgi:hypothetical protein